MDNVNMQEIHKIQMQILRQLLFQPNSRFSDLNVNGLTNDHFSYHIRVLKELELVDKKDERYSLTIKGKEFANRMDTDDSTIEKQPKISVLLIVEKEIDGIKKFAIQTRLKEPYYGYKGFMTGKIRYGEKVFEAAARELREEMGMEAEYEHLYILHEMVYDKEGNMLEDKFFNAIRAFNTKGDLTEKYEGGKNEWLTEEEIYKSDPIFHNEIEIFEWYKNGDKGFKEEIYYIETF